MKNQTYFTLDNPRGSMRQFKKADNYLEQRVKYDTGYFDGNARSIPAIVINGATENDAWYVVNLRHTTSNVFLQAIAVLGALDADQAIYAALQTFGDEYSHPTNDSVTVSEASYFALKRFLDIKQPFHGEITQDALNECQAQVSKQPTTWSDDNITSHNGSMAALMHDMVQSDVNGELLDPVSKYDAVDMFIGDDGVIETYDALITSYQRLDLLQERLATAMGRAAKGDITLTGVTRSKPFKRNGVVNVAVIYELSDGQTISVIFHNPDSTPTKLSAQDTLTSWKWLLNKRDVSIVLQPKNGENVQLNQLAIRMLKVAHQNSTRFKRTIAKRLENEKTLTDMVASQVELEKTEVALDAEIIDLQKQIDEKTKAVNLDLNGKVEVVAQKPVAEPVAPIDDNTMTTLMSDLEALGFTKQNGLDGLSNGDVAVSMHYSGEKAVVAVNDKQVLVSKSKEEIINFVKTLVKSEETNANNTPGEPVIEEVAESTPQPIVLTGNELGDFPDTPEGKKELRAAAKSSLETMVGEWVDCPALNGLEGNGAKVEIRKRGIKEFMAFSGNPKKLKLVSEIKKIIATAKISNDGWQENSKADKKPSVIGYYHLTNSIQIDKESIDVKVIIEKDSSGLLHYDVIVPKDVSFFDSLHIEIPEQPCPDNNSGGSSGIDNNLDNLLSTVNTFDSANGDDMVLNMFIVGEDGSDFTELPTNINEAVDAPVDLLTEPAEIHYSEQIINKLVSDYGWIKSAVGVNKQFTGMALAGELSDGTRQLSASFDDKKSRYLELAAGFDFIFDLDMREYGFSGDEGITKGAKVFNDKVDTYVNTEREKLAVKINPEEPAPDADTDYLQSIINGTADLATAGDELERIGEDLKPELEDLFEQAAEVYAQYAIAQAATI